MRYQLIAAMPLVFLIGFRLVEIHAGNPVGVIVDKGIELRSRSIDLGGGDWSQL